MPRKVYNHPQGLSPSFNWKSSQHAPASVYQFGPLRDFSEPCTDEKLYAKYGITPAEQKFIASMVKPMA